MGEVKKKKNVRPDVWIRWALLTLLSCGLLTMGMARFAGEGSAAALFAAMQIYMAGFALFFVALRRNVCRQVRLHASKQRFLNVRSEVRRGLLKSCVLSVVIGVLTIFFSAPVSRLAMGSGKAFLPLVAAGAAIILFGPQSVLQGFFEGLGASYGQERVSFAAEILRIVSGSALAVIMAYQAFRYGQKVDDLLLSSDNCVIYAACGAMCGLAIGNLIALFVLLLFRMRFHGQWKALIEGSEERKGRVKTSLLRSSLPLSLALVLPPLFPVAAAMLYVRRAGDDVSMIADAATSVAFFNGHFLSLMYVVAAALSLPQLTEVFRTGSLSGREEKNRTAARFLRILHIQFMLLFMAAALLMAVGEPLEMLLFDAYGKEAAVMFGYGSFLLVFIALSVTVTVLLQLKHRYELLLVLPPVSFVAGLAVCATVNAAFEGGSIHAVTTGMLVMTAFYAVGGCLSEAVQTGLPAAPFLQVFLKPLFSAALSALFAMLAARALQSSGNVMTALITGGLTGMVLYPLLLSFTGTLTDAEAARIPGGMMLKRKGKELSQKVLKRDGKPRGKRERKEPDQEEDA